MNIGDSVIFTEQGREFNATVLKVRHLDDHFGSNEEPLLHLGFFLIPERPGPDGIPRPVDLVGTHQQYDVVQFRLDVAHESHSWSEKQQVKYSKREYPGGRWREATISSFTGSMTEENPTGADGSAQLVATGSDLPMGYGTSLPGEEEKSGGRPLSIHEEHDADVQG